MSTSGPPWRASSKVTTVTGFLDLALEIRQTIYELALVSLSPITIGKTSLSKKYATNIVDREQHLRRLTGQLLRVCHQIHAEGSVYLYGHNYFETEEHIYCTLEKGNRLLTRSSDGAYTLVSPEEHQYSLLRVVQPIYRSLLQDTNMTLDFVKLRRFITSFYPDRDVFDWSFEAAPELRDVWQASVQCAQILTLKLPRMRLHIDCLLDPSGLDVNTWMPFAGSEAFAVRRVPVFSSLEALNEVRQWNDETGVHVPSRLTLSFSIHVREIVALVPTTCKKPLSLLNNALAELKQGNER